MGRIVIITTALAAFLAGPALCVGGVIRHSCARAAESDRACDSDFDHETGCGHEGGCSDDPCGTPVVSREETGDAWNAVTQLPPSIPESAAGAMQFSAPKVGVGPLKSPSRSSVPFPAGELPLLI